MNGLTVLAVLLTWLIARRWERIRERLIDWLLGPVPLERGWDDITSAPLTWPEPIAFYNGEQVHIRYRLGPYDQAREDR